MRSFGGSTWLPNRQNIATQKRAFPGFSEGLKMTELGFKWKGTAALVVTD